MFGACALGLVTRSEARFHDPDAFNAAVTKWCKMGTRDEAVELYGPIEDWDTSAVTDMDDLFYKQFHCSPDISRWDVSNVVTMQGMFEFATHFNADLSRWDVSSVTSAVNMFRGASDFTGAGLSAWKVDSLTNAGSMFNTALVFDADLSSWQVSKVTNMEDMFSYANSFKGEGVSSWDVTSVTNMDGIFSYATKMEADLSCWAVGTGVNTNPKSLARGTKAARLPEKGPGAMCRR